MILEILEKWMLSQIFSKILLYCVQKKNQEYVNESNYNVITYNHRLSKHKILRAMTIIYYILIKIPHKLRRLKADVISCQDLIALLIGWISTWLTVARNKPILVYDSHELEIARNTNGKRKNITNKIIPKLEKFLMKKASFSIFACDSAAKEVTDLYRLPQLPLVIRNVPYKWNIDTMRCKLAREKILKRMNLPEETFLIIYHGVIGYGRGVENLLYSIDGLEGVGLVILGMGEEEYIDNISKLITRLDLNNKAIILPAVSLSDLCDYLCATNAGMVTVQAVTKSYYYMLPNKFFENIQALNPIICSNFPEVQKIVNQYKIGLTVNPDNIDEIKSAIKELKDNKVLYNEFKANLVNAKNDLCWDNEAPKLIEKYKNILRREK